MTLISKTFMIPSNVMESLIEDRGSKIYQIRAWRGQTAHEGYSIHRIYDDYEQAENTYNDFVNDEKNFKVSLTSTYLPEGVRAIVNRGRGSEYNFKQVTLKSHKRKVGRTEFSNVGPLSRAYPGEKNRRFSIKLLTIKPKKYLVVDSDLNFERAYLRSREDVDKWMRMQVKKKY